MTKIGNATLDVLPDPDPYITFSHGTHPYEVFDWLRSRNQPVSNADGDILYYDLLTNTVRELQRDETLRVSTMAIGDGAPQIVGVYAVPPAPAQPAEPSKLHLDIRFTFSAVPDEFDENYTVLTLEKIKTRRNDLDDDQRTFIAEHWTQSDKFFTGTVYEIIEAATRDGKK